MGRPVIIGEIEMGDPPIKCPADDRPASFKHIPAAKILPKAERNWEALGRTDQRDDSRRRHSDPQQEYTLHLHEALADR